MKVYEYSLIRFVPRVEREEFINVGLILFSKQGKFIKAQFHIDAPKLALFKTEIDFEELSKHIASFERIAHGTANSGPIGQMSLEERFRWLTAVKSSCIQASRPHPGMTSDLEVVFKQLFEDLVL